MLFIVVASEVGAFSKSKVHVKLTCMVVHILGIVAARLALAHAKKLNQNVNGSSDAYDHIKYSDDPACRLSQKKRESAAKIALGRCQLVCLSFCH